MNNVPQGRPPVYTDDLEVYLHAEGRHKLQANSDRRAVVDVVLENKGVMSLGAIDQHFGFDIKRTVIALIRDGWLRVKI